MISSLNYIYNLSLKINLFKNINRKNYNVLFWFIIKLLIKYIYFSLNQYINNISIIIIINIKKVILKLISNFIRTVLLVLKKKDINNHKVLNINIIKQKNYFKKIII